MRLRLFIYNFFFLFLFLVFCFTLVEIILSEIAWLAEAFAVVEPVSMSAIGGSLCFALRMVAFRAHAAGNFNTILVWAVRSTDRCLLALELVN